MKITAKQIKELKDLSKRKKEVSFALSEQKKTLVERYGHNEIEIEREKKKIKVSEKILWDELFYGGINTQAGSILFEKYPELKKLALEEKKLVEELNLFTAKNWGFFYNEMSLGILIDIIISLIKYHLNPLNWFRK